MSEEFKYPRRRLMRGFVRRVTQVLFGILTDFHLVGEENLLTEGPLLVVANHFSFVDPMAMVRIAPWPMEFLGGFRAPNAPPLISWVRELWGYYPVFRGTGSTLALRASDEVMRQRGVLGVFPEGTSAAAVLRPPRPGVALIAARTGARILPVGLDGFINVLPKLVKGKRARVIARVGKPFGPFTASGRGRERREYLERIGHEIMHHVAELLPAERRGHYSDDPAIRAAAQGTEYYPFDDEPET